MRKIIVITFFTSFTIFAKEKGVHVIVVDPNIDASSIEKKYQVHRPKKHYSALPDRIAREELLKDVNATKGWDELKKDIFFMDLKNKSIDELVEKYKEIKREELESLKEKRG